MAKSSVRQAGKGHGMFNVVQSTTELQYVSSSPFPPTSSLSLVAPCLMGLIVTVQRVQVIEAVHVVW